MRGDCVEECQQNGSALPTPTPGPTSSNSGNNGEATYKTLKLGSKGTAVKALTAELKNQGYYTGAVTTSYTSAVQTAVKNFQQANGLQVDGIAGSATQHKLFGTVEPGSDTGNLDDDAVRGGEDRLVHRRHSAVVAQGRELQGL